MENSKKYFILAYYHFVFIERPQEEVLKHKAFFQDRDCTGRIYLSQEGINGQMSASAEDAQAYMAWLTEDTRFKEVDFKIHLYHEHVFPRMTVKERKQLVALDAAVDRSLTGEHLSPERWKEMLDEREEDTFLLDVRNDYEWKVGHFEGATLPSLEQFREFPTYAQQLKKELDPKKTKVMMYCTGGIRCELYSALLKQEGFEQVYQLKGGIIGYGLQEGKKHWRGKLFVFDDRLAVPLNEEGDEEAISSCCRCKGPSDTYYNCANMDCNALFLCCLACAQEFKGCCSGECQSAPRLRRFQKAEQPKPFRRAHLVSREET